MTYYTRSFNPQPTQRVASTDLKNEFQAVKNALDAVEVDVGKGVRAPEATTALPNAASRALKVMSFDASGNPRTTIAEVDLAAAATAASNAAASAGSSAASAVESEGFADAAALSAAAASTSATNAESSATASAGSASTATTQATSASGSATAAGASATAAAASASAASTSASNAATSATNAGNSATAAQAAQAAAEAAVASIPDGTINDATTGPLVVWSSDKVSSELDLKLNAASPTATGAIYDNGSVRGVITAVAAFDIDCSLGNYFTKTINGNSTFTVSSVPASGAYAFTLELTHTSGTVTWFSGVQWPGGIAPSLITGKTHLFTFVTDDGGTRWRGVANTNYTT